jgi:hypothetical protein
MESLKVVRRVTDELLNEKRLLGSRLQSQAIAFWGNPWFKPRSTTMVDCSVRSQGVQGLEERRYGSRTFERRGSKQSSRRPMLNTFCCPASSKPAPYRLVAASRYICCLIIRGF